MKKIVFTSFLALGFCFLASAGGTKKTTELKGVVTDKLGSPLAGVEINVPSIDKKIYTDFEGNFVVSDLPLEKQSIKLSYISFEEKEIAIDPSKINSSIHFELQSK